MNSIASSTKEAGAAEHRRRSLPEGGVEGVVDVGRGGRLRTRLWPETRAGAGTILFLNGRGDFIEKYCESYWAMRDWGPALLCFDWRGQGGSGRLARDPARGHAVDFDGYLDDLDRLLTLMATTLPRPWSVVAHSMGGHLALRWLARAPRQMACDLARAALIAPMVAFRTGPFPAVIARAIACSMRRMGYAEAFAFGQRPYAAGARRDWPSVVTSDPARASDESWWLERMPELASGGVTFGWLEAAFRSVAALDRAAVAASIATPSLFLLPRGDLLVDDRRASHFAGRMPHARVAWYEGARHELLRERDSARLDALARIRDFLLR